MRPHPTASTAGRLTLVVMVAVVVLLGACGGNLTPADTPAGQQVSDCEQLAEETADLIVDVADNATSSGGGLPPAALEADHPDDFDAWDLMESLAEGSSELEGRVEQAASTDERLGCSPEVLHGAVEPRVKDELSWRGERLSEEFDRDEYAAMNLIAIAASAFQPAPSSANVPAGFPEEFPVHPDATLVESGVNEDGSMTATWQVEDAFGAVADFYLESLQEGRLGGWDVSRSQRSETENLDGASTGRQRLKVSGYGFSGEVEVVSEDASQITVKATLAAQE